MIQNMTDQARRRMVLVLHAAEHGRLVEADTILIRDPASGTYRAAGPEARHAVDLGWLDLSSYFADPAGNPEYRPTNDGERAYRELLAWCRANPIRKTA